MPERQAMKLPDEGASVTGDDRKRLMRRAMYSGLSGTASGTLGSPMTAKPTLG